MAKSIHSSLKTAAKDTSLVFVGMAVSQALWFFSRLLITANVTREELGVYSLTVAIISVVAPLTGLGLWEGATRFISIYLGQDRNEAAFAVRRASLRIGILSGAASCAILFLASGVLSEYVFYKPELSLPLACMSFYIPVYVLTIVFASILRGYGMIGPNVYFLELGQPALFLLFIGVVFLVGLPFISVIYAYVLSMTVVFIMISRYARGRIEAIPVLVGFDRVTAGELMRFSLTVFSVDVMFLIFRWADTLMLGRYGTIDEVGVYSISVTLAAFLIFPHLALDTAYMPIAGELYAGNRSADLARTYRVLTKWIFSVSLPIFFILFFFPEMTITFLFGQRFAAAAVPLRILSIGYLIDTFLGSNSLLLLVMGFSGAVLKVAGAGAVLNVLLNYILIKHLGLGTSGAALASMASFAFISLGYSVVLYRVSGIHPLSSVYMKPIIGSAVVGLMIYGAAKNLPLHFWMLPLYFCLFVAGYITLLFLTHAIDAEDIFLFASILEKAGISPETAKRITGRML